MDIVQRARRVIQIEIDELQRLLERIGDPFERAVDALKVACERHRKMVVVGVGKSGNIGHKIAATLNSTGAPTVVLDSQNALHGDLGLVARGDVVIAMSQSGETRELLDLLPYLKRLDVTLIGLTGHSESSLAQHCDIVLDTRVKREACPLNLAPTSSTTVMLVLGDALAMALLEARGFRSEDFAALHPSGSLGRVLLTRVRDIMRHGDRMPQVAPDNEVQEVLRVMTRCRAGAAVVVNANGTLAGIFTHGDFVRWFQKVASIATHPVSHYMTVNPVSIQEDRLATEALQVLEKHRIDDLVVTDAEGFPRGLLDTQDLSRMKLL